MKDNRGDGGKDNRRLDRLVARNLGLPRRSAETLIEDGGITAADGARFDNARLSLADESLPLSVLCDGNPRTLHHDVHILLHKPAGCVTALHDGQHPTAYALLRSAPLHSELRPVGRLDKDSNGLLLFTTDGHLLHNLIRPKSRVPRTYQVALARPPQEVPKDFTLDDGHRPAIGELRPLLRGDLHPALARGDADVFATITMTGGAYHEVRRIFAALGSHVLGLCRVRFGRATLPADLAAGAWKFLHRSDLE